MARVAIADIRVVDRHRKDLGDIASLADSMRNLGQLQPIIVAPDLRLVAGERRLTAARSLGWTEVEATVVDSLTDAAAQLRAERDENTCRKAFTLTEEHTLYEALLALEVSRAEQDASTRSGGRPGGGRDPARPPTRAKESASAIVTGNVGRYKTLDKVGEIKRIAEDESQSEGLRVKAREALLEMDRTGNIAGAHTRVRLAVRAEEARRNADIESWSDDERALYNRLRDGETVVVSFRDHHSNLVRWAQAEGLLVSVDRRTEWGNPFEMPYDGDRETVIKHYAEHYLPHKPSLLKQVHELRGKALGCWCAPESCHADVLKGKADHA